MYTKKHVQKANGEKLHKMHENANIKKSLPESHESAEITKKVQQKNELWSGSGKCNKMQRKKKNDEAR